LFIGVDARRIRHAKEKSFLVLFFKKEQPFFFCLRTSPVTLHAVKALVFDVFGTVVDWRSGVARDAAPFLARYGASHADPHAFADAWRRRYMPAMEEVRSGRRPFVRLDVLHRENLLAILPEFGIDPAHVPPPALDDLNHAWHRLDPWPDAVAGLTRLRQRFIIAPLSNGNISLMIDMAKRAGLPWDAILGAEVAQAYKPMPAAYLRTADVLSLAPAALCLVAAHNGDLAAARACGLQTCFVPRPMEFGAGGRADSAPAQDWDLVVRDFEALAEAVGV
jgi:2-haloacid dehalogenase